MGLLTLTERCMERILMGLLEPELFTQEVLILIRRQPEVQVLIGMCHPVRVFRLARLYDGYANQASEFFCLNSGGRKKCTCRMGY